MEARMTTLSVLRGLTHSRTVGERALRYIGRVPTVRDHVQPRRPSHGRTNGKSIFLLRIHLCWPGSLTSLRSAVQSRKARLAM